MSHECNKAEDIATMKNDIRHLQDDREIDLNWRERIEDKLDKIIWFFLGGTSSLIIGVGIYVLTK